MGKTTYTKYKNIYLQKHIYIYYIQKRERVNRKRNNKKKEKQHHKLDKGKNHVNHVERYIKLQKNDLFFVIFLFYTTAIIIRHYYYYFILPYKHASITRKTK